MFWFTSIQFLTLPGSYIFTFFVLIHFCSISHFTRILYFHIFCFDSLLFSFSLYTRILYFHIFCFVLLCFDSLLFSFSLYQDPIFSHFLFWFTSVPFLILPGSYIFTFFVLIHFYSVSHFTPGSYIFTFFVLFCYVLIHFCSVSHFTRILYFHIFCFVLLCFDSLLFRFSLYRRSHIFTFLINLFLKKVLLS